MYMLSFIDPELLGLAKDAPWVAVSAVLFFTILKSIKWLGCKFNNIHDILFNKEDGKIIQLIDTQTDFVQSVKENNKQIRVDVLSTLEAIKSIEKKISYMSTIGFENMNSDYFNVLFEMTPIPITFVDGNLDIMRANEKCCELFGYSSDEIVDININYITSDIDKNIDITQAEKIKTGQLDFYRLEKTFIRKDGTPIYCIVYVYRIPSEGPFNHYIKIIIPTSGEYRIH